MTIKDIILAASGSIDGNTKCAIGLFHEIWNVDTDETSTLQQINIEKPIVNIFKHANYTQVDLVFKSKFDADLRNIWDMLTRFCETENSIDDDTTELPVIVLSIFPHELNGLYYILATNPIFYTLQPEDASGDPCVIRLVFDNDDFIVIKDNEEAINELKQEISNELERENIEKLDE